MRNTKEMARDLKFQIMEVGALYTIIVAKTKVLISSAATQ